MPFPPTFDNVWDITQPPDTQLANLLGQDIRNLKDDIMQRMSLLSGVLANRPTPETVNATWGGSGFGLLFFATDTGQVFQWNGVNWVAISISGLRLSDVGVHTLVNPPPGINNGSSVTIPINTLQPGSIVTIDARYKVTAYTSGQMIPKLQLGTTVRIFGGAIDNVGPGGPGRLTASFAVVSANVQVGVGVVFVHGVNPGFPSATLAATIDGSDVSANAFTIVTQVDNFASWIGTVVFDYLSVVVYP
jgi:hypothetical protein